MIWLDESTQYAIGVVYQIAKTLASILHIPISDDALQRLAEDNYLLANASEKHRRKTLTAELKRLHPSIATTNIPQAQTSPTTKFRLRSTVNSVGEAPNSNLQLPISNIPTITT
uniref:Transposase n=1 Tax=Strongyloides venezuelensis TaxID=75913 RepID=A0A0K0G424_STRVS